MTEAGIFDVASVQRDAVRTAISSAALALTVDVVVHRKKPTVSIEP
jgi:chaperonin GroEL (HSP60 family)